MVSTGVASNDMGLIWSVDQRSPTFPSLTPLTPRIVPGERSLPNGPGKKAKEGGMSILEVRPDQYSRESSGNTEPRSESAKNNSNNSRDREDCPKHPFCYVRGVRQRRYLNDAATLFRVRFTTRATRTSLTQSCDCEHSIRSIGLSLAKSMVLFRIQYIAHGLEGR